MWGHVGTKAAEEIHLYRYSKHVSICVFTCDLFDLHLYRYTFKHVSIFVYTCNLFDFHLYR